MFSGANCWGFESVVDSQHKPGSSKYVKFVPFGGFFG